MNNEIIYTDNSAVIANLQKQIQVLEALTETQKTIIDDYERKLSELTEQLDAAHIFNEGVKDGIIKKAWKWINTNYLKIVALRNVYDYNRLKQQFFSDLQKE